MVKEENKAFDSKEKQFALIGAFIAWLAVVLQFVLMLRNSSESMAETLLRFFSFFTILSNTLAAICLTSVASNSGRNRFFSSSSTLSAVTVYILIVGIVYNLVLRSTWHPQGLQRLVDELLHVVVPLYFFIFWVRFVRKESLRTNLIHNWLIFPFLYLICVLLRGDASGFYPYPFINAPEIGYTAVINNSLILIAFFVFLSLLLIGLAKLLVRKQKTKPEAS